MFLKPEPKTKEEKKDIVDGVLGKKKHKHKIKRMTITTHAGDPQIPEGQLQIQHTPVDSDATQSTTLPPSQAHVHILRLLGTGEAKNDLNTPSIPVPE